MIKIGAVNIDVSHPKAFCEYLKKDNKARYVAVYNNGFRKDNEVNAFIRKNSIDKRCDSIEELAEYVDIGFIHSCNWDNHLEQAIPFIERGKPVFIDKPIAGSLADCLAFEEYEKNGAVILGSSSMRYADEIVNLLNMSEKERGKIVSVFGSAGLDEFNYGIHTVEPIHELAQSDAVSCRYIGADKIDGGNCETFFIEFKNGVTAVYNTYSGVWQPHILSVSTTKTTYNFTLDTSRVYGALLDRICDFMENKENRIASVKKITESIKIMLAGRLSREQNGREIKLDNIPKEDPGYDGEEFEKQYAANASEIYLEE